jgi:hypothetical protein
LTGNIFRSGPETTAGLDRQHLPVSLYKNTHLTILILIIPSREMHFSNKKTNTTHRHYPLIGTVGDNHRTGTTGVRLTCTLTKPKSSFFSLQFAPALSGSRPTPRRHFAPYSYEIAATVGQSWRPLRSSSGDCGARAGGTGSAGCAGRRRIVAALARGSLLWAPTKRGREHRPQTTCHRRAGEILAAARSGVGATKSMTSPLFPQEADIILPRNI